MNLGAVIKSLRKENNLTQQELADLCKMTQTAISQIESGNKRPGEGTLKKFSKHLHVPLPMLYFLSTEESDIEPAKRAGYKMVFPAVKSMLITFFLHDNEK